jgi:flagellum-specific peptidoglycan hydrolase FlgJ
MHSPSKPWWQQVTALVSLSAGGAITGFSFVPGAADIKSPASIPIHLLALKQSNQQAPAGDGMLRSAIVNVASYYLRMAAGKTPAEVEAIIWQHDSVDGIDHGESCAAFASLTLELAAQVVGQQSWVTGGSSYPWPLHEWADVRVDPNPASLGIISISQDAVAHQRWHPLGDGYQPSPGDWVLFNGHVEVVTEYAAGVLHTIGGDSLPNFSINAHEFRDPLAAQGVVGFVNNGGVPGASNPAPRSPERVSARHQAQGHGSAAQAAIPGTPVPGSPAPVGSPAVASPPPVGASKATTSAKPTRPASSASPTSSAKPASSARPASSAKPAGPASSASSASPAAALRARAPGDAAIPGMPVSVPAPTPSAHMGPAGRQARQEPAHPPDGSPPATPGTAAIPGLPTGVQPLAAGSTAPSATPVSRQHPSPPATALHDTTAQQAFIGEVAPGAIAAQQRYGVPASVTIAQAIEESAWGQSALATTDHNLFGIKGTGPAGSDPLPTQEFENGQSVTHIALFRVYHDAAESIDDHGKLLATSGYYRRAMADTQDPNAFAAALTGVYATDPDYGSKLIDLMQRYDLYRYNSAPAATPAAATPRAATPRAATPRAATPRAATARAATPRAATPRAPTPSASTPSASTPSASTPSASTPQAATPGAPSPRASTPGEAIIPGLPQADPVPSASTSRQAAGPGATSGRVRQSDVSRPRSKATPSTLTASFRRAAAPANCQTRKAASRDARASTSTSPYRQHIPPSVRNAFTTVAKARLMREESLYRDVASNSGIRWELLAACDWMQCEARTRYSPVHGEKLGAVNLDGTMYRTKSEALAQCGDDLVELAWAVYRIDLTAPGNLSVRDLANAFAAFRWGGLLKMHHTSAMEFPYSVAGLTDHHINMRWPRIDDPNTPDKPGGRFRMPFGAVPVVLSLNYSATV